MEILICEYCKKEKLSQIDIKMKIGFISNLSGECQECGRQNEKLFSYEELERYKLDEKTPLYKLQFRKEELEKVIENIKQKIKEVYAHADEESYNLTKNLDSAEEELELIKTDIKFKSTPIKDYTIRATA